MGVTDRPESTVPEKSISDLVCPIRGLDKNEKVVWLKDGRVFMPSGDRVKFSRLGRTITFSPVVADDAGLYSCVSELSGTTLSQILKVGKPIYPGQFF